MLHAHEQKKTDLTKQNDIDYGLITPPAGEWDVLGGEHFILKVDCKSRKKDKSRIVMARSGHWVSPWSTVS